MLAETTGSNPTPFGFVAAGQYQTDGDSGLMLLGERYYYNTTGRFISQDPIPAGANWYAYCGNAPLGGVDPSGLDYTAKLPDSVPMGPPTLEGPPANPPPSLFGPGSGIPVVFTPGVGNPVGGGPIGGSGTVQIGDPKGNGVSFGGQGFGNGPVTGSVNVGVKPLGGLQGTGSVGGIGGKTPSWGGGINGPIGPGTTGSIGGTSGGKNPGGSVGVGIGGNTITVIGIFGPNPGLQVTTPMPKGKVFGGNGSITVTTPLKGGKPTGTISVGWPVRLL
jgi:RHS repeat-associated protein